MNSQLTFDYLYDGAREEKNMQFRTKKAFFAVSVMLLILLPQIAVTAALQDGGMPDDSNPDNKNADSYIEFDRQRLLSLFAGAGTNNPTNTASQINTKHAGTISLPVTVNPLMPRSKRAGVKSEIIGTNPDIGNMNHIESDMQELQYRIDQDTKRLDQDMALLLPGNNPAVAGAELLKLLQEFFDEHGVKVTSRNYLPEKKQDMLTKISVRIETSCAIEQLVQVMAAIGNYSIFLKIEEIMISSFRMPIQGRYEIRPSFTIAGYIRSMEETKPGESAACIQTKEIKTNIQSLENLLCKNDMNLSEYIHSAEGDLPAIRTACIQAEELAAIIKSLDNIVCNKDMSLSEYIRSKGENISAEIAARVQITELEAKIQSLEDILHKKDNNLKVLRELTLVLPQDTYLNTYVNRNGTIQIVGITGSPADLIPVLGKSPIFKEVKMMAPFRTRSAGQDLFNIEMRFED
jgi:hypothetical protein